MHTVDQFFAHLAARVGDDRTRAVDALVIGVALGMSNQMILRYVAELTERGWIEPLAQSPYGTLQVRVLHTSP